jgi:hypothetical protein
LYRNATTAGARVYVDVDATNSPVETSITTTTVTSTNPERAFILSSASTVTTLTFAPGEIVLAPGESLTVGVQNSNNSGTECIGTINWSEQF